MTKKFIKQKVGEQVGFRTPNFLRTKSFGGGKPINQQKFNVGQYKTQHKG
jgi:hypothetical protein